MGFLENIDDGTINIKKMGIMKAIFVMIIAILLEWLGQVPGEFLNLFSGKFESALPYVVFTFGVMVKYYVIIVLLKLFSNKVNYQKPKQKLNIMGFVYVTLLIIGFRVIFDNSLIFWVSKIPMPNLINKPFEEQAISPILLILSLVVIAPIYEEVIFRGILLKGMANKINPNIALVVSALLFAVVHLNIPQGINAFLLGLITGFIYLKTESIYLSIFAHFVNNFLAITVSSMFTSIEGKYVMTIHRIFFILGVILLVIVYNAYKQNKVTDIPEIYKEFIEI
ncbi:type II CAAX endopeptidase family protein [Clostridium sp.]|uniref:CPBP family intramembrane glutamic endopeptidase n=1 Tax=Clostridium sp. TaxID=1506 RepID=UPI001A4B8796|nr:type II CAAX endopeptidase family protein [Clostridium sp.]MBK5241104.1 CPBP family intramembrane metalloprotease [Clostridium sp.]